MAAEEAGPGALKRALTDRLAAVAVEMMGWSSAFGVASQSRSLTDMQAKTEAVDVVM